MEFATTDFLSRAVPWRTFRWRDGQRHYSGTYWSATNRDHVIYESRLELARLLLADYDTAVLNVIAQPFLLRARVNRRMRRHIPDFRCSPTPFLMVVDEAAAPACGGQGAFHVGLDPRTRRDTRLAVRGVERLA